MELSEFTEIPQGGFYPQAELGLPVWTKVRYFREGRKYGAFFEREVRHDEVVSLAMGTGLLVQYMVHNPAERPYGDVWIPVLPTRRRPKPETISVKGEFRTLAAFKVTNPDLIEHQPKADAAVCRCKESQG